MLFLFGDSHARILVPVGDDDHHLVERRDGTWRLLATGGATAHNLLSEGSLSGCGRRIVGTLDGTPGPKHVLLMFGEVDVVDHIARTDDPAAGLAQTQSRYHEFVGRLAERDDVHRVILVGGIPRTKAFKMNGREAPELNDLIREWDRGLGPHVKLFDSLRGEDGFLRPKLAHSPGDRGERHLSPLGGQLVWQQIELFLPHLPPYPLGLLTH